MDAERQEARANSATTPLWPAILLGGITAAWLVGLAGLAAVSANPRIVDRRQIALSDAVLTGRIADPGQGLVAVDEWLRGEPRGDRIRVRELDELEILPGDRHLFPLTFLQQGDDLAEYVVTPVDPNGYGGPGRPEGEVRPMQLLPVSGEVERQIHEIFGGKRE